MINRQGHSAMRQFRWRNTKSPWPVTSDLYIYNVAIPILHWHWNDDVFGGSGYDWNAMWLRVAEEHSFNILFLTPPLLKCMNYGQSFSTNTDRYLKPLTYIKNKCVKIFVDSVQIFVRNVLWFHGLLAVGLWSVLCWTPNVRGIPRTNPSPIQVVDFSLNFIIIRCTILRRVKCYRKFIMMCHRGEYVLTLVSLFVSKILQSSGRKFLPHPQTVIHWKNDFNFKGFLRIEMFYYGVVQY